jgi:hypothetical protein
VESGNGVLDAGTARGLDANCGNDGSLLVEYWNVKDARGDAVQGRMQGGMGRFGANRMQGGSCTAGWGRMRVRGFARATRVEVCL